MTETPQVDDFAPIRYREAATKYYLASRVLRNYSCFKSAYIVGAYAQGFPHPSAIINIVAFTHQGDPVDIQRVHMVAIGEPVELVVSPPEDVMKGIRRWKLIRLE